MGGGGDYRENMSKRVPDSLTWVKEESKERRCVSGGRNAFPDRVSNVPEVVKKSEKKRKDVEIDSEVCRGVSERE